MEVLVRLCNSWGWKVPAFCGGRSEVPRGWDCLTRHCLFQLTFQGSSELPVDMEPIKGNCQAQV